MVGRGAATVAVRTLLGWMALALVGSSACTPRRTPGTVQGAAAVYGCVRVDVLDDLDYLVPRQTRLENISVVIEPDDPAGRGGPMVRTYTDRAGCFYQDGLAPGPYRLVRISAPGGRRGSPGPVTPDLEFPLWESALRLASDGVTAVPTAQGAIDQAEFHLQPGETRYLGHFVLEYRRSPFPPRSDCLSRLTRLGGIEGDVYLSSDPVAVRLCRVSRPDDARSWLAGREH